MRLQVRDICYDVGGQAGDESTERAQSGLMSTGMKRFNLNVRHSK